MYSSCYEFGIPQASHVEVFPAAPFGSGHVSGAKGGALGLFSAEAPFEFFFGDIDDGRSAMRAGEGEFAFGELGDEGFGFQCRERVVSLDGMFACGHGEFGLIDDMCGMIFLHEC